MKDEEYQKELDKCLFDTQPTFEHHKGEGKMEMKKKTEGPRNSRIIERALQAYDAILEEATEEGLWDLHTALQKGSFDSAEGPARLVRGRWGSLGESESSRGNRSTGLRDGCVLNVLFHREAHSYKGGVTLVTALSEHCAGKRGFKAADFYGAWDAGLLSAEELLKRLDRHLTRRIITPGGGTAA